MVLVFLFALQWHVFLANASRSTGCRERRTFLCRHVCVYMLVAVVCLTSSQFFVDLAGPCLPELVEPCVGDRCDAARSRPSRFLSARVAIHTVCMFETMKVMQTKQLSLLGEFLPCVCRAFSLWLSASILLAPEISILERAGSHAGAGCLH